MKEFQLIPTFKSDEDPRPNKNIYTLLSDFSSYKDKPREELTVYEELRRETLNDVYKALEENNQDLVVLLNSLESYGVISNGDKLFITCLLLTSDSIGPDLKQIKVMIDSKKINFETVESEIDASDINPVVKNCLMSVLNKINSYWQDLRVQEKI